MSSSLSPFLRHLDELTAQKHNKYKTEQQCETLIISASCRRYLDFKPEDPRGGVEAVGIEDKIFPAQVELRGAVPEGPGGETGSSVRHQVEGHVAGTCTRTKWLL